MLAESTLFKVERSTSPSSSSSSSSSSTANSNIVSIILVSQENHPLAPLYLDSARSLAATSPDVTKEELAKIAEGMLLEYAAKDEVIDAVGDKGNRKKERSRKRDEEDGDDSGELAFFETRRLNTRTSLTPFSSFRSRPHSQIHLDPPRRRRKRPCRRRSRSRSQRATVRFRSPSCLRIRVERRRLTRASFHSFFSSPSGGPRSKKKAKT